MFAEWYVAIDLLPTLILYDQLIVTLLLCRMFLKTGCVRLSKRFQVCMIFFIGLWSHLFTVFGIISILIVSLKIHCFRLTVTNGILIFLNFMLCWVESCLLGKHVMFLWISQLQVSTPLYTGSRLTLVRAVPCLQETL